MSKFDILSPLSLVIFSFGLKLFKVFSCIFIFYFRFLHQKIKQNKMSIITEAESAVTECITVPDSEPVTEVISVPDSSIPARGSDPVSFVTSLVHKTLPLLTHLTFTLLRIPVL